MSEGASQQQQQGLLASAFWKTQWCAEKFANRAERIFFKGLKISSTCGSVTPFSGPPVSVSSPAEVHAIVHVLNAACAFKAPVKFPCERIFT